MVVLTFHVGALTYFNTSKCSHDSLHPGKAGSCKQPLIRLPFWKLLLTQQFFLIQFIAKIFQGSLFDLIRQNKKKKYIAPSPQFKRGPPKVTINFIMHDWLSENMNSSWVIAEYNAIKPNYIVGHRFYPFF